MSESSIAAESEDWIENDEVRTILEDQLDETDYKIFKTLNENGRISDTELGEQVGLSRTAARRRREKLQDEGVIDVLAVMVLQEAGLAYADIQVSFSADATEPEINEFMQSLGEDELIYEINEYLGSQDLLVRAWHASLYELKTYMSERLRGTHAVDEYEIRPIVKTRKAWQKTISDGS